MRWSFAARLRRDGRDGADPVPDRPCDRRDPRPRPPRAVRAGRSRSRSPAWPGWAERVSPAGRRPGLARGRGRPAQPPLRAASRRSSSSFFDRQQTGQLMSRATVDLQAVRFFLGYGLIFIAQSLLTIAARRGRDVRAAAGAGGDRAGAGAVRRADRLRYGRRSRPAHAGGPAADRRADRRRRGERLRRARRQGVRPGGPPARLASATRSRACSTRQMLRDQDPGALQPADQLPAEPRAGR